MKLKTVPALCCAAALAAGAAMLAINHNTITSSAATNEPSTCALTTLELTVTTTGDCKIVAALTNSFTLFSSTVKVKLYLYSSLTKTTDITEMTLEDSAYSADLNMGDYIQAESTTHNEDRYWVGYAIYYKSSGNKYYQTEPQFYYANGTYNPAY